MNERTVQYTVRGDLSWRYARIPEWLTREAFLLSVTTAHRVPASAVVILTTL